MKLYLKLDHCDEDDLITSLIKTALQSFEMFVASTLFPAKVEVICFANDSAKITLPRRPVISIEELMISYSAEVGKSEHMLSPKDWVINERGCIYLRYRRFFQYCRVRYTAGIVKDGSEVPEVLRGIMMRHAAHLYENRWSNENFDMEEYGRYKKYLL